MVSGCFDANSRDSTSPCQQYKLAFSTDLLRSTKRTYARGSLRTSDPGLFNLLCQVTKLKATDKHWSEKGCLKPVFRRLEHTSWASETSQRADKQTTGSRIKTGSEQRISNPPDGQHLGEPGKCCWQLLCSRPAAPTCRLPQALPESRRPPQHGR
jgi:hypothetical protein